METWKCSTCGEFHQELLMDIAFQKPQQYLEIPCEERVDRVWIDAETNADLCVIDNSSYLIRAFLPLNIESGNIFRFGVWVKIDRVDFLEYYETKWNLEITPVYQGVISSKIPGYSQTEELTVDVQVQGYNDRPTLILHSSNHQLSLEQRNGITLSRVHEIIETCLPEWFE
jgi:hypothetical protein